VYLRLVVWAYTVWFISRFVVYPFGVAVGKISLFVKVRKQGARVDSVPLRRLKRLSACREKRWEFKDGWLILEALNGGDSGG
jgi:hypothetical protein